VHDRKNASGLKKESWLVGGKSGGPKTVKGKAEDGGKKIPTVLKWGGKKRRCPGGLSF